MWQGSLEKISGKTHLRPTARVLVVDFAAFVQGAKLNEICQNLIECIITQETPSLLITKCNHLHLAIADGSNPILGVRTLQHNVRKYVGTT